MPLQDRQLRLIYDGLAALACALATLAYIFSHKFDVLNLDLGQDSTGAQLLAASLVFLSYLTIFDRAGHWFQGRYRGLIIIFAGSMSSVFNLYLYSSLDIGQALRFAFTLGAVCAVVTTPLLLFFRCVGFIHRKLRRNPKV